MSACADPTNWTDCGMNWTSNSGAMVPFGVMTTNYFNAIRQAMLERARVVPLGLAGFHHDRQYWLTNPVTTFTLPAPGDMYWLWEGGCEDILGLPNDVTDTLIPKFLNHVSPDPWDTWTTTGIIVEAGYGQYDDATNLVSTNFFKYPARLNDGTNHVYGHFGALDVITWEWYHQIYKILNLLQYTYEGLASVTGATYSVGQGTSTGSWSLAKTDCQTNWASSGGSGNCWAYTRYWSNGATYVADASRQSGYLTVGGLDTNTPGKVSFYICCERVTNDDYYAQSDHGANEGEWTLFYSASTANTNATKSSSLYGSTNFPTGWDGSPPGSVGYAWTSTPRSSVQWYFDFRDW